MSRKPLINIAAMLALAASSGPGAFAAENAALIDILQQKGVLSKTEADSVRAELTKGTEPASNIKLNTAISELKLYGDLRLRYQYDSKDAQLLRDQGGGANVSQQSRWRFRLRLNADFKLAESVFGGIELQTSQAADSGMQTYENGFNDYSIFISKAFVGWKPNAWLTVTGGKLGNPFYSTELTWDPDINPTGVAEVIAFHKLGAESNEAAAGYSKDGKETKAVAAAEKPWELSLVAGQFIYDDNRESGGPDSDLSTDAYLFETQLIASYKFGGTKVTFAPAWFTYINGSLSDLDNANPFVDPVAGLGGTRNLNLLLAPGDISFKVAGLKTKIYWDFSYNLEGRKRVEDIYGLANVVGAPQHESIDDFAYMVGVQFGENKKAGDWAFYANWRQTGLGAVDPNVNDSDYAQAELNTRGVKVGAVYNLSDFANLGVSYGYAWNLRDTLYGGQTTGGTAIADSNEIQVFQVDLNVKF